MVVVGVVLFALTTLLALFAGPIRGWSDLSVPNSLTSSVPDALVWVLVFLLAFCLALLTTAAIHGPWWLSVLGLLSVGLLLGAWSIATTTTRGVVLAAGIPVLAMAAIVVLLVTRRRRGLAWWEFPLVLGLIGLVLDPVPARLRRLRPAARLPLRARSSSTRRSACSPSWCCRPPSRPVPRSPRSRSG